MLVKKPYVCGSCDTTTVLIMGATTPTTVRSLTIVMCIYVLCIAVVFTTVDV